jgi:hypothetical protein
MHPRPASGKGRAKAARRHGPEWKANDQLAVGKGATVQEFVAWAARGS